MVVFLWIWKIIGPIFFFWGCFYWGWCDEMPLRPRMALILGAICGVIGIILGFTGWAEDVAPRMFWIKSKTELLDNKIGYALSMGVQMFLLPAGIAFIVWCINWFTNH